MLHELSDGMSSISDTFLENRSDESDGLCLVEDETPGESLLSQRACLERREVCCVGCNEMENGPGEGEVYLVPLGRSSWFGIKTITRLLSPSPSHDPI
jgi:hypothetical protein